MRWLGRAFLVGLAAIAVAGAALLFHGPLGPLASGPLFGEVVREPVRDWSFSDRHAEIQVEVRVGPVAYSVTTWCLSHEGALYVPSRNGGDKQWVRQVLAHPDARIRVAERIYPVRFERVSEPDPALAPLLLEKYLGVEVASARAVEAGPGPRAGIWMFRVESRDAR